MIKALLIVFIIVVVGALVLQSCAPVTTTEASTTKMNMTLIIDAENYEIWRFSDSSGSTVSTCWLSIPKHSLYPPNIFCR